jgi:hypothetical protein
MATRTINSPGVEIRERDLSLIAPSNVGTNVFVTGYADQGPIDEVIKITTKDELELVFGSPTNSAERYFYHSVSELLNSPANIYTSRLPYGVGTGTGFGSKFSGLVYPVVSYTGIPGYEFSISGSTLTDASLSSAQATIALSDGSTATVGFSSASTAPSSTDLDAYALYVSPDPDTTDIITNLETAIASLDDSATFTSTVSSLEVTLSASSAPVTAPDYSKLPAEVTVTETAGDNTSLDVTGGTYLLGAPTHLEFSRAEYESVLKGEAFTWSSSASASDAFTTLESLGGAGLIILNKAQTTLNDQFEGYYVGLTDNMFVNPGSEYESIRGVKTLNSSEDFTRSFITVPESTLEFNLSSQYQFGASSVSETLENVASYDMTGADDDDMLGIMTFKLRKSLFGTEAFKLDYVVEDKLLGSIDYAKSSLAPTGGPSINTFIGNADTKSRNVEIFVNDFIADRLGGTAVGIDGVPKRKVRVLSQQLVDGNNYSRSGVTDEFLSTISNTEYGDFLYAFGAYNSRRIDQKTLGNVPTKIERSLLAVRNQDLYDIDVVVEAGLGTVYAASSASQTTFFDEFRYDSKLAAQVEALRTTNPELDATGTTMRNNYMAVFQAFETFCSPIYKNGGRGDCIFIADPIRHIYVSGKNVKIDGLKTSIFQKDIYWATRHQFENANTSYACTYANWAKVYDQFIGQNTWVPFSGFAAAIMARTDAARFPWIAPAGFNNGLVQTALEIASTPNQKQRDELYKSNLNPITFFPAQGPVVFGQKTLQRKPSAFDRINVRRLFQALERPSRKAAQYFVFEPNTIFTRTRLVNVLTPIFERALNNEGVYDYLIVCDERNNTPEIIDNNELVVDIYIKPVRAAEFILINFIATRTDANFQEIIGA